MNQKNSSSKKILIVDDNPDILEALSFVLESENYKVYQTTQYENVLPLIEKTKPNLVLMDVFLSGIDGRVLLESIKQNPRTNQIPIIMISAYPYVRKSVLNSGADEFIEKPFKVEKLLDTIGGIIDS